jgi:hypothetical protein
MIIYHNFIPALYTITDGGIAVTNKTDMEALQSKTQKFTATAGRASVFGILAVGGHRVLTAITSLTPFSEAMTKVGSTDTTFEHRIRVLIESGQKFVPFIKANGNALPLSPWCFFIKAYWDFNDLPRLNQWNWFIRSCWDDKR